MTFEMPENSLKNFSQNFVTQSFSIPKTIISYILQRNNKVLLQKSHEFIYKINSLCKYFFFKLQLIPCTPLNVESNYFELWYAYPKKSSTTVSFSNLEKLTALICPDVLCTDLSLNFHPEKATRAPPKSISSLISRIVNYRIKHLSLNNQELSLKEFKFLTLNDKCEIIFHSCTIVYKDGSIVPAEKLLEISPKLSQFSLFCDENTEINYCTPLTSQKLAAFPPFKYLCCFKLFNVPNYFEAEHFIEFVKKNYKNSLFKEYEYKTQVVFRITFKNNVNPALVQDFKSKVIAAVQLLETPNNQILCSVR